MLRPWSSRTVRSWRHIRPQRSNSASSRSMAVRTPPCLSSWSWQMRAGLPTGRPCIDWPHLGFSPQINIFINWVSQLKSLTASIQQYMVANCEVPGKDDRMRRIPYCRIAVGPVSNITDLLIPSRLSSFSTLVSSFRFTLMFDIVLCCIDHCTIAFALFGGGI